MALSNLYQSSLKYKKFALRLLLFLFFFTLISLPLLELHRRDTCDESGLKHMIVMLVSVYYSKKFFMINLGADEKQMKMDMIIVT